MPRRGKGEGSIRLRPDGRWEARLPVSPGGRAKDRRSFYGSTRAEVARKLTDALKATDDHLPIPGERLIVETFLAQWLEVKAKNLRPESARRYTDLVELHLIPELGQLSLARLLPEHLEQAYSRLRAKGLSGTTLQMAHGVMHTALATAARRSHVVRNVADLVDPPTRTTPTMDTLGPEQAARLLKAAEGDPLEAFYALALTCGLRLGELQALRWKNVDVDRRRLAVVATYQGNVAGEPVFSEPKTAKSKRTVHLSELAAEALRNHRTRQLERRLQAGAAWVDHDLVFCSAFGKPLDGNNLRTRSFARLLKRAELPPMRFHSLRHAAATLLMADGVPVKAISELLGHSDVTTTLRIYAHVLETTQQDAANAMDRRFGAIRGQSGGQTP